VHSAAVTNLDRRILFFAVEGVQVQQTLLEKVDELHHLLGGQGALSGRGTESGGASERASERETDRERAGERVCVCVCVREREREKKRARERERARGWSSKRER
jgi:hypothetical protein